MYITDVLTRTKKGKVSHRCVLLRESFRKDGKVCNRTVANLTHCPPAEVAALRLVLKHKKELDRFRFDGPQTETCADSFSLEQGDSVGATWTIYRVACQLGIAAALGDSWQGKLALWQVLARVMDQGSRLSAVRLAQNHAACDVIGIRRGFDENDLYANLKWLSVQQADIEDRLFARRYPQNPPGLYLYDVTSTYLEGAKNALGAFGYNRDGKRGKLQLVIGLLCDGEGNPLSIEVFAGNTQDPKTFASQVRKAAQRFGGGQVTFVGDRGMLKAPQIKDLAHHGFHYITAITKPQIDKLLEQNILHMELFEDAVAEVESATEGRRYVLRRNHVRAAEMDASRKAKLAALEKWLQAANEELAQSQRCKVAPRLRDAQLRAQKLKIAAWVQIQAQARTLSLKIDRAELQEEQKLDGCYVIITDLAVAVADKNTVHQRYKDLAEVEQAFRCSKTVHLEIRPVYVTTEPSTRGHALVVMLGYQIIRHLKQAWDRFDLTVEAGVGELMQVCAMKVIRQGQVVANRIPKPRPDSVKLLAALEIKLPEILPHLDTPVVTRKKLQSRRKKRWFS